jgi:hypothetical protein
MSRHKRVDLSIIKSEKNQLGEGCKRVWLVRVLEDAN